MLQVKNLTFSYGKKGAPQLFQNLNIDFKPGFNVILGPNGAGKTTLMKAIFGLLPARGQIIFDQRDITGCSVAERTHLMAYLPQMDVTASALTVMEMVLLGRLPELGRRVTDADLSIVHAALSALGMADLAERPFSMLSGGQQKLVLIAQTLVREPSLILLDEPVNFLDMQKQLELCELLCSIVERKSIDVIAILHDINLAARFSQNIVVLTKAGQVYSQGCPKAVITQTMLREVYGVDGRMALDEDGMPYAVIRRSL